MYHVHRRDTKMEDDKKQREKKGEEVIECGTMGEEEGVEARGIVGGLAGVGNREKANGRGWRTFVRAALLINEIEAISIVAHEAWPTTHSISVVADYWLLFGWGKAYEFV
jgi:hypothetical protein